MLDITICIRKVRIFSAFLHVQNQKPRAVETSFQGPENWLDELGTSSRPVLCQSCCGGSTVFGFGFMAEELVRFSRLLSPSLLSWRQLKCQQRPIIFWMATMRYNWRGVYSKAGLKHSWTLKVRCKFKLWSKPHLLSKNSWKEQAFSWKNVFLVPCDSLQVTFSNNLLVSI